MSTPTKTIPGGLLICFEGIDGAGKTTQLEQLADYLRSTSWLVQTTRSMGGTPIGEALRAVSFSDFERPAATDLYIAQAMQEALMLKIEAWRDDGAIILLDRGPFSTAAYQIYGDKLEPGLGWRMVESNLVRLKIDLVLLYTIPVSKALARLSHKAEKTNYFESKTATYFEDVQAGYNEAASRYPALEIDGEPAIADVQKHTRDAVQALLQQKLTSV